MSVRITLSEPVAVARGPRMEDAGWGPYQFPALARLDDGSICASFHDSRDSAEDYAVPPLAYLSFDEGRSFQPAPEFDMARAGAKLPGGDRITALALPPEPFAGAAKAEGVNGFGEEVCRLDALPEGAIDARWPFLRLRAGAESSERERAKVTQPNRSVCRLKDGRLIPPKAFGRLRVSPSGELWHTTYGTELSPENGGFSPYYSCLYFSSEDEGHSWRYRSWIHYAPDLRRDANAFRYEGFCEADVAFPPAGGMITLMRTDGRGPSYLAYSEDGETWSEPKRFDRCGVWPCLLTLGNGITLASYGRPGIFVRATDDPKALAWGEPTTVIPDEDRAYLRNPNARAPYEGKDPGTCSYTDILALGDDEALLIYTDFYAPDEAGVKRKTIFTRSIRATHA